MATVKTKPKTTTSKLKAGKKKKVSKKLIVLGVALVAIIGAAVVGFSSASSWYSIYRSTTSSTVSRLSFNQTRPVDLRQGKNIRFCARGHARSGTSTVKLSFNKNTAPYRVGVAPSTKTYGTKSQLHCSNILYTHKAYTVAGVVEYVSGNNFIIEALSIDELR